MGIEGIADEIEMPWGFDTHDLPLGLKLTFRTAESSDKTKADFRSLDRWCLSLKSEIK